MLLKGQEHRGHLPPSELAETLLNERAVIARHIDRVRELRQLRRREEELKEQRRLAQPLEPIPV